VRAVRLWKRGAPWATVSIPEASVRAARCSSIRATSPVQEGIEVKGLLKSPGGYAARARRLGRLTAVIDWIQDWEELPGTRAIGYALIIGFLVVLALAIFFFVGAPLV
jgi:hypothetical protein